MALRFVEWGWKRLQASPEFQERCRVREAEIRTRYVQALAGASFFQRWLIRRRMYAEIRRLRPSRRTLW